MPSFISHKTNASITDSIFISQPKHNITNQKAQTSPKRKVYNLREKEKKRRGDLLVERRARMELLADEVAHGNVRDF